MKSILILLSISSLIFITSCKKKTTHCDYGEVCVKNISNDSIYYSWGGNDMSKYVLSGETVCNRTNEAIDISKNEESYSVVYFETIGHSSYAIRVKDCHIDYEVD